MKRDNDGCIYHIEFLTCIKEAPNSSHREPNGLV